ncbi:MAG: RDD family protein, partial [Candidatus Baltobacteraceae bacterium]
FVDFALQLAVAAAALLLAVWLVPGVAPAKAASAGKLAGALLLALAIVAAFLLFFGYFIVFEWLWQGRTPGKRIVGIRVVRDGGFPLDFTSSVIRNVVRLLEFSLGFYALSAFVVLASPLNRRLGDMAAGTLVVRDARYERAPAPMPRALEREDPVVRELSAAECDLVRRYAARRATLRNAARPAVAAKIAALVRPKLGATFDHLSDDDLLVHLAETALR